MDSSRSLLARNGITEITEKGQKGDRDGATGQVAALTETETSKAPYL